LAARKLFRECAPVSVFFRDARFQVIYRLGAELRRSKSAIIADEPAWLYDPQNLIRRIIVMRDKTIRI
jgi:hypothetical protein